MAWETILKIKEEVAKLSIDKNRLLSASSIETTKSSPSLNQSPYTVCVQLFKIKRDFRDFDIIVKCHEPFLCEIEYRIEISIPFRYLFELYIPYALLPYFAIKLRKSFVVAHFAQTLDGRIASIAGDSKWIGNQENLVHAHRMRALLDGVLIGAKTMVSDNPLLTVRHVMGDDPKKIIIGGDNLNIEDYNMGNDEIISFSQNLKSKGPNYQFEKQNNIYNTREILDTLYKLNIYSVYIEGGSITTSTFLKQKTIDQVQVHFAPIILGSGSTGFNFEGASHLRDAIYFKSYKYVSIGDQMMFIGEL